MYRIERNLSLSGWTTRRNRSFRKLKSSDNCRQLSIFKFRCDCLMGGAGQSMACTDSLSAKKQGLTRDAKPWERVSDPAVGGATGPESIEIV